MTVLTSNELLGVFIEFQDRLERVLLARLGCRSTAQDLAQDLYLKLEPLSDRFPSEDDARRFLVRMALNAATDHNRIEHRRQARLVEMFDVMSPAHFSVETVIIRFDEMERVDEVLDELPPKCRSVLYMSRLEGLTHNEIACRLGVSRSLVEKYAARAVQHCQSRLKSADMRQRCFA